MQIVSHFFKRPSALSYMAQACVLKHVQKDVIGAPSIKAIWHDYIPTDIHPIILQANSIRLSMSILTHPKFPIPIWQILQIRNQITQRKVLPSNINVEMEATLKETRVLTKGVEFDIHVIVTPGSEIFFESINTFYAKRKFKNGQAQTQKTKREVPSLSLEQEKWTISKEGVWNFAKVTGDYNGVHFLNSYAKFFGFNSAFAHPHRALMSIFEHLPRVDVSSPFQLNVYFKGPVYYAKQLLLSYQEENGILDFALRVDGDGRPAILGSIKV